MRGGNEERRIGGWERRAIIGEGSSRGIEEERCFLAMWVLEMVPLTSLWKEVLVATISHQ